MSDIKKSSTVKITFNDEVVKNIPLVLSKYGFLEIDKTIKKVLPKYMPKDTETLLNSYYFIRDENGKIGFFVVGSKAGDDRLNKIAIYQHEKELKHYGTPGQSMRKGTNARSSIPGEKWAINGVTLKTAKEMLRAEPVSGNKKGKKTQSIQSIQRIQINDYHRGYNALKKSGSLTPYKSEYLKKAVEETISEFIKIIAQQKLTEGKI
ncbi:MAG TPA: hypothetical protein PK771_08375 [Spirochaetota bacterium]|nr:hypothetical protein [Spirochaetota bacterium]